MSGNLIFHFGSFFFFFKENLKSVHKNITTGKLVVRTRLKTR